MILVDVYIPAIEQTCEFRLEETCCPDVIIGEICEMVEQREQMGSGEKEKFLLFDVNLQQQLSCEKTLAESNVTDGHLLLLV